MKTVSYKINKLISSQSIWIRLKMLLFIISCLPFIFGTALGAANPALEYAIKGAYLYKFGAFVEWPSSAFPEQNTPFIIGILGNDPFGGALDEMVQNKTINGRPIVIAHFKQAEQAKAAHVLYIGPGEAEKLPQILSHLRGANVLTVSDESKEVSGIINFVLQENKVRFEINPDAASRAGLKVSSKLLSVAKTVHTDK